MSSISLSCGYGTFASASSTFMWPGIRPATGWMAYLTSTPACLEQLGQLADGVLGLGHGQAVAGHDDDRAGVGELDRGVVDADLADGAAGPATAPTVPSPPPKPPSMMFRIDRFIASAMSLVRMRARGADEGAGDDQHRVVDARSRPSPRPCR